MNRIVLLLLLFASALFAQPAPPPSAILKGTPPGGVGGACSASPTIGYLNSSGNIYTCKSSVWTLYGGGGGSSPLTTKGDIYGFSTVDARLPVGSDGNTIVADSTQALGVKWAAGAGGTVNTYTGDHTAGAGDCGNWSAMNGSSLTFTLASPPISTACQFAIQNINASTALTISRNGLTINGASADISIAARSGSTAGSVMCWTDGTNYNCSGGAAGAAGAAGGSGITVYSGLAGITLTNATIYFPFGGGSGASATEANVQSHVQSAATVSNLGVDLSTSLTSTNTGVFTVRKNGADTSLTCTVTSPSLTCADTTSGHAFTVSANDTLDVKAVFTGTISATPIFVINAQAGTSSSGGGGGTPAPPYLTISSVPYAPIFAVTPPSGSFSWANQNGSSVNSVNGALSFTMVSTASTDHLTCYMQALPGSAGADYTAQIGILSSPQGAQGVALSDGTKFVFVYTQPGLQTVFQKWNSTTSFNGNYYTAAAMAFAGPMFWVQFQQTGASRIMSFSPDGATWTPQYTSSTQSKDDFLTETQFGVCQETNMQTNAKFQLVSYKVTNP